jgi:hypothetical protein
MALVRRFSLPVLKYDFGEEVENLQTNAEKFFFEVSTKAAKRMGFFTYLHP